MAAYKPDMLPHEFEVVIVSPFSPKAVGHGGNHRGYQIQRDAANVVGDSHVHALYLDRWAADHPNVGATSQNPAARVARGVSRRWRYYRENPLRAVTPTHFTPHAPVPSGIIRDYTELVSGLAAPAVCITQHVGLGQFSDINRALGVPTLLCPDDLESLTHSLQVTQESHRPVASLHAVAADFANEIHAIRSYQALLSISRTETGLYMGLGLPAEWYPYVPVGAIRERNWSIRQARRESTIRRGLFLLVGTAQHYPTRRSIQWFIDEAAQHGLPDGVRVVVAGPGTEEFKVADVPGLDIVGWLGQEELDDALVHAQAALVPQRIGFGSLTRVPELSCAGIPVLASALPGHTMDLPPGVETLDSDWGSWCEAMTRPMDVVVQDSSYVGWESRQPRTLQSALPKLANPMSQRNSHPEKAH